MMFFPWVIVRRKLELFSIFFTILKFRVFFTYLAIIKVKKVLQNEDFYTSLFIYFNNHQNNFIYVQKM